MNLTSDRIRSIGWIAVLTVCAGLTAGFALHVNAVKSEVHEAEMRILRLRQEIVFLETEFKTRANQQQLKILNEVEFGYDAPRAEQYIEGERQLAALGMPRAPGAPRPIMVAKASTEARPEGLLAMVSPLTGMAPPAREAEQAAPTGYGGAEAGKPAKSPVKIAEAAAPADAIGAAITAAGLGGRLSRIDPAGPAAP